MNLQVIRSCVLLARAEIQEFVAQLRGALTASILVSVLLAAMYGVWLLEIFPVLRINVQAPFTSIKLTQAPVVAQAIVVLLQTGVVLAFFGTVAYECRGYITNSSVLRVFIMRTRDPRSISIFLITRIALQFLLIIEVVLYPITWAPFLNLMTRTELASILAAKLAVYAVVILTLSAVVSANLCLAKAQKAVVFAWVFGIIYYIFVAAILWRLQYEIRNIDDAKLLVVVGKALAVWVRPDLQPWRDIATGATVCVSLCLSYFILKFGVWRAFS